MLATGKHEFYERFLWKNLKSKGSHDAAFLFRLMNHPNQDNLNAQKCYQKCGFQIVDIIEDRMSDDTIAVRYVMACNL